MMPTASLPPLRPRRLRAGDTIGLINPSGAIYERLHYELAHEALGALGLRVKEGPHLRARYGHMAGTPQQRAADIHQHLDDPQVAGILAVTGGSGANRVLPHLDFERFARHPKFLGGFSDLTSLITAVQVRTGLVTFHSPLGRSEWNAFSVEHFRAVAMEGLAHTMRNEVPKVDDLVAREGRIQTVRGGKAQGRLVGGNLAVLTSLAGTPYWPDFDGAILFLEDVNEYIYRIDRMLSTLMLSGALGRLAGVALGGFTDCPVSEGSFGTLTLDEVFDDYFAGLGIPVYRGAQFGHVKRKFTIPLGVMAEIDADAGTLRLLEPAVSDG